VTEGDANLQRDVDRLLADRNPDIQAIAGALRTVIRTQLPGVVEQVDFGDKLIAFGHSMKMRDLLFAVIPHTAHVNLQLADGIDLPDPTGIVEGTGKRIRHVKVRSVGDANRDDIQALVRAQIERRVAG
jgi:hypothetical protein